MATYDVTGAGGTAGHSANGRTPYMIENTIDNEFLAGIHSNEHSFGAQTTKDVIEWLYWIYGKLSASKIAKNSTDLNCPVDPTKSITTYSNRSKISNKK